MYASIKYDGYRGITLNGNFYSPDAKVFSNKILPEFFRPLFDLTNNFGVVFDGELWSESLDFHTLGGNLRGHRGALATIEYHIFDILSIEEWNSTKQTRFIDRYVRLNSFDKLLPSNCRIVQQIPCLNPTVAEETYGTFLAAGHEGIILRSPRGLYKNNRCTHLESNCYKFKHFQTDDAIIVGFVQRRKLKAGLDRTYKAYGLLEKVSTQESFDLDDALGALEVRLENGDHTYVNLGRGFSYQDRRDLWQERDCLVGKTVEFKWMPHGTKDLPRIGSVVRFRPDKDSQ